MNSLLSVCCCVRLFWASLVAQMVKSLPAMQETQVPSWVRKIPWRREWQLTPVLLPGEFHGQRSLVGFTPWGSKELDMTGQLTRSTKSLSFICYFSENLLFFVKVLLWAQVLTPIWVAHHWVFPYVYSDAHIYKLLIVLLLLICLLTI